MKLAVPSHLCFIFICYALLCAQAFCTNPLFDEVNYPDNFHSTDRKVQARFMFRLAHKIDMIAIKEMFMMGRKEKALALLSEARIIYTKASLLDPKNAMIKIFAEAHDYLRPDGSLIRGTKEAKLALSNLYDEDDNETPIDPELKAFWLGKAFQKKNKPEATHSERDTLRAKETKDDDKKEDDTEDNKAAVVDGRMASLFVLSGVTGAGGLEMGKYLTENVALQYLSGGGGFVVGFIAYVIAIKVMTCISTNRTQAKETKKTEELLKRIEVMLNKKSHAHELSTDDDQESCIDCACHRPTCWQIRRWFCCCCCHNNLRQRTRHAAPPTPKHRKQYLSAAGNSDDNDALPRDALYAASRRRSSEPVIESSESDYATNIEENIDDPEEENLAEEIQERLLQFGANDPIVQEYMKSKKEKCKAARDTLTIKYTPPNSSDDSDDDATDPPNPDEVFKSETISSYDDSQEKPGHIAIDIVNWQNDNELDSAASEAKQ